MCNTHFRYGVSAAPVCLCKRSASLSLVVSVLARVPSGVVMKIVVQGLSVSGCNAPHLEHGQCKQ